MKLDKCSATCWCEFCNQKIPKDEHYLDLRKSAFKGIARINICIGCINKLNKQISRRELQNKRVRETEQKI